MASILFTPGMGITAPYAAMVIDARTGEVLHSRNADTRLHPASLTKMMTLYVAFEAIRKGEISLDTRVKVSNKAAAEPPSKLYLKAGQRIQVRYLIRASAVKSANDAATALGEAISGSEAAFARRMNRTAKALGMTKTTFKNAHGLTESGHMSTARDMTTLGRRILYDYPDYYNLFSRMSTHAGVREVANTNRRLLSNYRGADGIKTGYTRAAGFNLVASAKRGNERIIATVFGGRSSATRNAKVAELLDLGFRRAPSNAPLRKPSLPQYTAVAKAPTKKGKTIRILTAVKKSYRPKMRPTPEAPSQELLLALADDIEQAVKEAAKTPDAEVEADVVTTKPVVLAATRSPKPRVRPTVAQPTVVTRISTNGDRHWGINVGKYGSRYKAEQVLLRTHLMEMNTLDGSLRKVAKRKNGFDANFLGMTKDTAALACRRLEARSVKCAVLGPS
ncbi:D-alanyl-D-alanine carboxypeptidase family protein [Nereida sp. MMG025]|uniref:D-alanyl-D-alanine carboxypeptidase family protein n=1 Tax=Nereida sp. MMG025 TaxID=2909981 RepID=UPI001F16CC69|nr:D-alanyl-D-alanine carboxypeptidase family protein [Nereida sp. MMG025]MCF6445825.1 serine hydrolase [Nereida sp. MMG025]